MKIVFSRKGMDSTAGGIPSPILPDGTLLSLPIPERASGVQYSQISYQGKSYQQTIKELKGSFDFNSYPCCHLDPDIFDGIAGRPDIWKPAFGQEDISAKHLDNQGVSAGDLFLYFGWYRQTEYGAGGDLRYVKGAPDLHIIYGYLFIGSIIDDADTIRNQYGWHPHSNAAYTVNNRLYIPADGNIPGTSLRCYGTLLSSPKRILTEPGQRNRSRWALPSFFDGVTITGQKEKPVMSGQGYAVLESAGRGQEFVINADPVNREKIEKWAVDVIS